jgi:hypothetical protein
VGQCIRESIESQSGEGIHEGRGMLREAEGHKIRGCKVHQNVEVHDAKGCTVRPGDVRLCSVLGASVLGDHGPVTKESRRPPGKFLADN